MRTCAINCINLSRARVNRALHFMWRVRGQEAAPSILINPDDTPIVRVEGPLSLPDSSGFGIEKDEVVHILCLVQLEPSEIIIPAAIDGAKVEIVYGENPALVLIPYAVVDLREPPGSRFQANEGPHVVRLVEFVSLSGFLVDPVKEMHLERVFLGPSFPFDGSLRMKFLRVSRKAKQDAGSDDEETFHGQSAYRFADKYTR